MKKIPAQKLIIFNFYLNVEEPIDEFTEEMLRLAVIKKLNVLVNEIVEDNDDLTITNPVGCVECFIKESIYVFPPSECLQ